MGKYYYCDICGTEVFQHQDICPNCKNYIRPKASLYDSDYYRQKSELKVGDYSQARQILIDEEVSKNPRFNPNTNVHNAEAEYNQRMKDIFKPKPQTQPNQPKCPTCGSTNIEKISVTKRAIHGAVFGLLSSTARSQMQCKNCGYKW